ncbi:gas vesicle protein [Streptomyces radiopugnans]|uniref:Gas vesicle protein n=1 Tax=Streptomyces radiopugnans TaxID=403935 RepID=A0A1H8ZE07_9ACTN|nr:gas vesicle protein [Streptomyces radiopugnans]SEP62659.1 Gas vesicle protein [Streptomyces radiopugnans]
MSDYQERGVPAEAGTVRPAPPRVPAAPRARTLTPQQPLEPRRDGEGSLAHVVETLLDKGLVLNADIMVSVAGVELLGIRLRAALASFETAARYGLEFPSGTDVETAAWREAREERDTCPECGKRSPVSQLLEDMCPWCGWRSARARLAESRAAPRALPDDGGPGCGGPDDGGGPENGGGPDDGGGGGRDG